MTFTHLWILHFLWLLPVAALVLVVYSRQKKKAMEQVDRKGEKVRLLGEPS